MKQKARLENWHVINGILFGTVYGHPLLPDGAFIQTSGLAIISDDKKSAETLNTIYELSNTLYTQEKLDA